MRSPTKKRRNWPTTAPRFLHPRTLAPLIEKGIPVWSKNSFNLAAPGTRIVTTDARGAAGSPGRHFDGERRAGFRGCREGRGERHGHHGRALDALAGAGSEVLAFSSSSYRQNFCFLIRKEELEAALDGLESEFELELEHDYLQPIKVDTK